MSKDKKKDDGFWHEDGRKVVKGWPKGRPGKAPGSKIRQDNPRGWGQSWYKSGPTRGSSSTGNDRRGGWFFRGSR